MIIMITTQVNGYIVTYCDCNCKYFKSSDKVQQFFFLGRGTGGQKVEGKFFTEGRISN